MKVQPEKPDLPTEPGSVIIATEVRGVRSKWRLLLDDEGDWRSAGSISGYHWHGPEHITAWTKARVVPDAAPVTLTDDQVGEVWDAVGGPEGHRWEAWRSTFRRRLTATVNAFLAQYATPAEQCLRLRQECYDDLAVDSDLCQGCLDEAGTCEDCERKECDCRC